MLHHFIPPTAVCQSSCCSTCSLIFGVVSLLHFDHSIWCEDLPHYFNEYLIHFNVYLPDDWGSLAPLQVLIEHSKIFFCKMFKTFGNFYLVVCLLLLICRSSLNIRIIFFCQIYIFSQSVACKFSMVWLDDQNSKILMNIFSFMTSTFYFLINLCQSCGIILLCFLLEIYSF